MEVIWWTSWGRGGGSFNNQTGPILVHIYPLFNLHVKYRSNLIRILWVKIKNMKKKIIIFFLGGGGGVMLGPYIKSRGTKMSANEDLITVETYVQGKEFENQFFIYGPKCKKKLYFGLFGGPWGGSSMIRMGLSCFPTILSPISMYMSNKEAIW